MVAMILGHLSRMFKKVAQRGRSERGGVDPLHWRATGTQDVEPLTGTHCLAACNGCTRTKLAAFFNILSVAPQGRGGKSPQLRPDGPPHGLQHGIQIWG